MSILRHFLIVAFAMAAAVDVRGGEVKTIANFQATNRVIGAPEWEQTPEALTSSTMEAVAKGNAALDEIGSQDLEYVTFENTIVALENLRADANLIANRAALIYDTHPDPTMRAVAESAVKKFEQWKIAIDYREDIFNAVSAFAATRPKLIGEDQKLLEDALRDFRRAGIRLPAGERKKVARMRRDLAELVARFDANVSEATAPLVFTRGELDGVPEEFLSSPGVEIDHNHYQVMAHLTWQYHTVLDNARSETTRRRLYIAHDSLAKEANVPLVNHILTLRNQIALRLGYKSWADYQAEVRMAKTAASAEAFIEDLAARIQPKFDAEVAVLQKTKAADTNDRNAKIHLWDWRYYVNQLTRRNLTVDRDVLRDFFPLPQTVDGMFATFGRVFGLRFDEIEPQLKWTDDLRLYVISDTARKAPLGLVYLDLFPRDGKTGRGGEFEIVSGRRLADGTYQAPVAAVVLNFPPPGDGKPSLLSHAEVETLFHEAGHALHSILTRAKYSRFAGTHVPVDFVEAPSQMLQNWVWDKRVLDIFAVDYRDRIESGATLKVATAPHASYKTAPRRKIPTKIIARMDEAKVAAAGMFYRRQFAFALADLALHAAHPPDAPYDCVAISNQIFERVFLPIDPETSFISSFRGFDGYDAGYYGYAWADAIAADMATVFERVGYLDRRAGLKLRREIYEPGDSRDVTQSIEKFLGRKQSVEALLKKLGATTAPTALTPSK